MRRDDAVGDDDCVIWEAKPTARQVVRELLVSLIVSGAYVVMIILLPTHDPLHGWPALIPPVLSAARSLITTVRGRVVLRRDGIEVRRVLTRRYPWSSLLSLTVEEDGRIEITPEGWVRKLPIPSKEVPEAFAIITEWRAAAEQRA